MPAVIFRRYYNLPEAHVEFATLKAGGFHPSFHNQHHGVLNALSLIAYGGLIILIPEPEFDDAHSFIAQMQAVDVLPNFEPMPERPFGKWKTGTLLAWPSGFFLPFFLLPIWLQLCAFLIAWGLFSVIFWGGTSATLLNRTIFSFLSLTPLLAMISIIFHATHYAKSKSKSGKSI